MLSYVHLPSEDTVLAFLSISLEKVGYADKLLAFHTLGGGGGSYNLLNSSRNCLSERKAHCEIQLSIFFWQNITLVKTKVYSIQYSATARLFKFSIACSSSTRSWYVVWVALCYDLGKQHSDFCWDYFRFTYLVLLLGSLQCNVVQRYLCRYGSNLLVRVQSSAWVIIYHSFFQINYSLY